MSGDVLILGASVGGLVAATYLAQAGAHVTVLEAAAMPGGRAANKIAVGDYAVPEGPHTFAALDPRVVKELKLTGLGLGFACRDLPAVVLQGGRSLTLSRDAHETQRGLAAVSEKDAERYPVARREQFAFARAMRALWWDDGALAGDKKRATLRRLQLTESIAWLESQFESDDLKAAFAFDTLQAPPAAAGSALVLAWQAAQEMCGLQGAVAVPAGGPATLVNALVFAAQTAGVDIRLQAEVARLDIDGEAVRGAVLTSGESVAGRTVLSSLTRRKTLLELLAPGAVGFAAAQRLHPAEVGEAKLVLALKVCPAAFARPARYLIAERLEAAALAYAEARTGKLPSDLFLEAVVLDPGTSHSGNSQDVLLSVLIRPVPVTPLDGWRTASPHLVQAVLKSLEHHLPDLAATITGLGFVPPQSADAFHLTDMTVSWRARIATPVRGLFLCGAAAEPVPSVSGRAGRIAAAMAASHLREAGA
jgi:phytoene dehydrogenase-like protein